jgi:predicted lipid-binding transport protein (Tim44 family)
MPQTRTALALALALVLAGAAASAQTPAPDPVQQAPRTAIPVEETAPPGSSGPIAGGALIGLLAGIFVVTLIFSGN